MQRPEFSSIVAGMMLVMAIPAIFAALVIKSRSFDHNRYEFDPNRTWSVLEQGREFKDLKTADAAVKQEMERLALERKNLVENVKKLDEAMLALRSVAGTSPAVAQRFPRVLQSLAGVRKSVGLDGPQQLLDYTAPPVDLRAMAAAGLARTRAWRQQPALPAGPAGNPPAPTAAGVNGKWLEPSRDRSRAGRGARAPAQARRHVAAGGIAARMDCRQVGRTPPGNIQRRQPLREDRRACRELHPVWRQGHGLRLLPPDGRPSNELQLYIFEMADPLKALGKYGSEKPDEFKAVPIGDEGYTTAGSTLFYSGRYYTQIVSTQDDPKFSAFALDLAKRVAARQKPGGSAATTAASTDRLAWPVPRAQPQPAQRAGAAPATKHRPEPAAGQAKPNPAPSRGYSRDVLRALAGSEPAGRRQVCRPGCFWL